MSCIASTSHTRTNIATTKRKISFQKELKKDWPLKPSYIVPLHRMSLVMRKPAFCICENKDTDQLRSNCAADQRSCAVTAQLISAFVFTIRMVQSPFYINPKFQASSHLLWLCIPICVGPGRKPWRQVFSQRGSYVTSNRKRKRANNRGWQQPGLTDSALTLNPGERRLNEFFRGTLQWSVAVNMSL